eukprot:TRINITY_DN17984_c0_g1_i1.p1 TRINITY_DN17984_c0_g1~~TRINITY_DN17984_c0_g1_i1.p1  ORF type:complete len:282 (+),score=66.31 TRINITY_DN17984_c0_g1_i1:85-930(+)
MAPRRSAAPLRFGAVACFGFLACRELLRTTSSPEQSVSEPSLAFTTVLSPSDHHAARSAFGLRGGVSAMPKAESPAQSPVAREAMDVELPLTGIRAFVQHILRWPGRMSERWLGPVNFDRAGLRLDTMDTYAAVASLFMGCLLGLYGCVSDPEEDAPKSAKTLFEVQMALLMFSTLCASFTTFVFLINKLFAATAMGLWKDVAFFTYQYHTAFQRKLAFWGLVLSMISFIACFALNLYEKIQGKKGKYAAFFTLGAGAIMSLSCKELMDLANKLIFTTYPY